MTQDEKAKAYDEALKAAIVAHKDEDRHLKATLERIFPELQESEDERARKEIIDFIYDKTDTYELREKSNSWLAWLEKQGEIGKESYEIAEKEKREFVDDGFIKCYADFKDFKEGKTYWLEYVGNDSYNVRSDNLLGKTYHITPCQLYTIFKKQTWLEKQDEQKLIDKIEPKFKVGDTIYYNSFGRLVSFVIANIVEDGTDNPMYEDKDGNSVFQNDIVEQKPIDKVEPKFHEGEWITNGDYTWKIVEVKPLDYILQSQGGNIVDDTISYVDEQFHSFNIKDAKDGDVLCTYECCEPKIVFILKGTPKKHYALSYHCYYNIMYPHFGSDSEKGCLAPKDEDVKPATKEQCDLLFSKMKEAGYEWDAEKKELRKINSYCQDNCKGFQETGRCFCDGECKAKKEHIKQNLQDNSFRRMFEQKPAWSEEDDSNLNVVIAKVQSDINNGWIGRNRELLTWLESLKDRVCLKQEWSEEDKKMFVNIKACLRNTKKDYSRELDWLKSIRPQKQWKPSEEQIKSLEEVINEGHFTSYPNSLETLYELLKKLREE